MARKDRTGNIKTRELRSKCHTPKAKYYLIVTDMNTSVYSYFTGFYNSLPEELKRKIAIKTVDTKAQDIVQKCHELVCYDVQCRIPWIIIDCSHVENYDQIVKRAEAVGINVAWSNPCFETWLFTYFGKNPNTQDPGTCCSEFENVYKNRTGQIYSKSDPDIYKRLCEFGDEEDALSISTQKHEHHTSRGKSLPSNMCPSTTVHKLVGEIRSKAKLFDE